MYVRKYVCVPRMYACVCTYVRTFVCTTDTAYVCMRVYVCMYVLVHLHQQICIHVCCTCFGMYVHCAVYMHACMLACVFASLQADHGLGPTPTPTVGASRSLSPSDSWPQRKFFLSPGAPVFLPYSNTSMFACKPPCIYAAPFKGDTDIYQSEREGLCEEGGVQFVSPVQLCFQFVVVVVGVYEGCEA